MLSFSYFSVSRRLRPLLTRAVKDFDPTSIDSSARIEIAEALLAASKTGSISSRKNAIQLAKDILGDDEPLEFQIDMTRQESVLMRLSGDYAQSERATHDFCHRLATHPQADELSIRQFYGSLNTSLKIHALYGRLHASHLENLVQSDEYTTAIDEIDD